MEQEGLSLSGQLGPGVNVTKVKEDDAHGPVGCPLDH